MILGLVAMREKFCMNAVRHQKSLSPLKIIHTYLVTMYAVNSVRHCFNFQLSCILKAFYFLPNTCVHSD